MGSASIRTLSVPHSGFLFNAGVPTQASGTLPALPLPQLPQHAVLIAAILPLSDRLSCYVGQTELARPGLEQDRIFILGSRTALEYI